MSDDAPANLSRPATPTSMGHTGSVGRAKSPEDINTDRLHLILGMETGFDTKASRHLKSLFISLTLLSLVVLVLYSSVRDQCGVPVFSAL